MDVPAAPRAGGAARSGSTSVTSPARLSSITTSTWACRGALDFLPAASFDAIHESRLFGSPEFRSAYGRATERIRREIHRQEQRLLRPGGILIHSDGRGVGRPGALS